MKEAVKYTFTVRHPEYGEWRGAALDSGDALVLAASHWGARWTEIAGECAITKWGKAVTVRCVRCGGPIFSGPPQSRKALWGEEEQGSGADARQPAGRSGTDFATTKGGVICMGCQERERQARRERDRVIRPPDRRARYARG